MGFDLTPAQVELLLTFKAELMRWNERVNLTALAGELEVIEKHLLDSLGCVRYMYPHGGGDGRNWQIPLRIADIGSGAGLPGVVVRIVMGGERVTVMLIDAAAKRVAFLRHVVRTLGLTGIEVRQGRAEELGRVNGLREGFDVVVARAVARLPILVEYCLPFVRVGGVFLAMKGPGWREELAGAEKAVGVLGGRVEGTGVYSLPFSGDARAVVVVRKVAGTPAGYPRRAGVPERRPLT